MGVVQTLPLESDEQDLQQSIQEIRELIEIDPHEKGYTSIYE